MSKRSLFFIILSASVFAGCSKQVGNGQPGKEDLLAAAIQYYENERQHTVLPNPQATLRESGNPRKKLAYHPDWSRAKCTKFQGDPAVIAPLLYDKPVLFTTTLAPQLALNADDLTWLLIRNNRKGGKVMEVLTWYPDSMGLRNRLTRPSGLILVEDGARRPIASYYMGADGTVRKATSATTASVPGNARASLASQEVCLYANGYNYGVDDPTGGYYWSELITCATYTPEPPSSALIPSGYDYSGSVSTAAGSISPRSTFAVRSPDNPITDLKSYLQCFVNMAGSNYLYQVELCVSQPWPGTRLPWVITDPFGNDMSPVDVGHTFLILTEKTPTGTITRNIGFFPATTAKPTSPIAPGILNNDEKRTYNIKLTIAMTNSQFFSILSYIFKAGQPGVQYNLSSNNCTTFAIAAINSAGFRIPITMSEWYKGFGCNPGDLGEDIRKMTLSANMSRTTSFTTHENAGVCKQNQ